MDVPFVKKEKATLVSSVRFGRNVWLSMFGVAAVALLVYGVTMATYVFPGESAALFAQWTGVETMDFPSHPVWGAFVRAFAALPGSVDPVLKVNLLSYVCGVLAAALFVPLMYFFVAIRTYQEDTLRKSSAAGLAAGLVAALSFVFATAAWQASTHLDYRIFDVAYALCLFALFPIATSFPRFTWPATALLGFGVGAGLVESEIFFPLLPLYFVEMILLYRRRGKSFYGASGLFLLALVVGYGWVVADAFGAYAATEAAKTAGLDSTFKVFVKSLSYTARAAGAWFSRPGWLFVQVLVTFPFVACAKIASRGLNNERTLSQYLFHGGMTVLSILALATPLSPESLMRPWGVLPVATTAMSVFAAGYLAAYWYLLFAAKKTVAEDQTESNLAKMGTVVAPVAGVLFVVILVLTAIINAFSCTRGRGAFADACANAILDRLDGRTWFVTDGLLDEHLRVAAARRGQELNLVCLQRDMDDAYLKRLSALVKEKRLGGGRTDLTLSIQLGVLPFLQDWFNADTNVEREVAIFGVPDIWYMSERVPNPECFFFGGVQNVKRVDGKKALAKFKAFWKEIEPSLPLEGRGGSYHIRDIDDPVARLRVQLRRHIGFVCNNLGVTLEDLGLETEAFETYELVLKTIDPDNVCALFNEFEMARRNVACAASHKQEIERALKAIVDDTKRRYLLWSLSRYYGYIRSPEIFARMGYAWARSGQTGNAIAQVQRAIDFVPTDRQMGLLNMMAAIYANDNQRKKSREVYQQVLEHDENNHDALMGLTRLALQEGALDKAREYLGKAVKTSQAKDGAGFEFALLSLMNNDLASARLSLQKVTDMQPKSLQAWSLLAGVLLQQADQAKDEKAKRKVMDELENVILPRMEKIASSPRDYFLQMTRALVLMRKGPNFRKAARDALVVAGMVRPDVTVTGDMILNLDISLDDGESAEKHARQILRRNRHDKLANYVMGSLRLREGDYSTAETFLRLSAEAEQPIAAAQNDLAEVLRRTMKYEEAESYARAAVKTQPELYVAWETLGSSLLDQKKSLEEAETCVKKAISLAKKNNNIEDLRMQITLARVQLAKGDFGRARGTIRLLRSKQAELSKYDRGELDKLIRASEKK